MLEVKGSSLLTILILPGVSLISFANKCHLFVMGYFDIISAVQVWDLVRLIVAWIRSSLLVILGRPLPKPMPLPSASSPSNPRPSPSITVSLALEEGPHVGTN